MSMADIAKSNAEYFERKVETYEANVRGAKTEDERVVWQSLLDSERESLVYWRKSAENFSA